MLANDEIRATSDELGTTLHAQAQRIGDCSRSVHEKWGYARRLKCNRFISLIAETSRSIAAVTH